MQPSFIDHALYGYSVHVRLPPGSISTLQIAIVLQGTSGGWLVGVSYGTPRPSDTLWMQ